MARPARTDRWQHLVTGAFSLDQQGGRRERERVPDEVLAYLDSVLEVFGSGIDPLEDFEGYAVRRMATALRERLASAKQGGKTK